MINYDFHFKYFEKLLIHYDWQIILKEHQKIVSKKLIAVNEFFLDINFFNDHFLLIKSTKCNFPDKKYYELLLFLNLLNNHCLNSCYVLDEEFTYLSYKKSIKFNSMRSLKDQELIDLYEQELKEVHRLSQKLSFGIHQILFGECKVNDIRESLFLKTVGNA